DSVRPSAVSERHRRLVSRASPQTRRHSGANVRCADHHEKFTREGGLVDGKRTESTGRTGRSRKELGTDGPDLQHVLSEEQTGAILLWNYRLPPSGAVAANRLHRLRGLTAR